MHIYWEKKINAQSVGQRVASVECTKCGCKYFYLLTRIGVGEGTAPYSIGTASATRSAQQESQRDVEQQLAAEAELVPCPSCHWINDDLVRGFRLGRYRHAGKLALGVGAAGTAISLVFGWALSVGPAVNRETAPFLLFGGPLFFISLAAATLLHRSWVWNRIQPNRDFPLPPKLPPGTPPALLLDRSSGKLIPSKPTESRTSDADDCCQFAIGRDRLPLICCSCLQSAAATQRYECQLTPAFRLDVPRCAACARKASCRAHKIGSVVFVPVMLIGIAITVSLGLAPYEFWITAGISFVISAAVASGFACAVTAPVKILGSDVFSGVYKLRFRNVEYARVVAKHLSDSRASANGIQGRSSAP
jgi:hypothetical protein